MSLRDSGTDRLDPHPAKPKNPLRVRIVEIETDADPGGEAWGEVIDILLTASERPEKPAW